MKRTFLFILLSIFFFSANAQINTNRVLTVGKNAFYFEDYILSIQYFNQVIKSKPYLAEPYLYRAMAKLNLDDYKGAENDLTFCLERNPFLIHAYLYRGIARQYSGDIEGAIKDYDKGLEFRPEDKQMLINKGIAYMQNKNYDSALVTLDLLTKYHPKFVQAYLTKGSACSEKGDTLAALADFNKSIELDKYFAPAYGQRALLFYHMGKYPEAATDFTEAIRLEPKQTGYYINRGLVRYYMNDLRGAMADYDAVMALDANNTIARFNRGLLREQVGDVYRAIEDFDVVIKNEPDNFMAIYNRAILNNEAHNYRNAAADLDTVLKEYPYFVPGYYFRSEIKRALRDLKGADADYWYAYDLEQKLRKEREKGKIITGKAILDAPDKNAKPEDDTAKKTREKSDKDIEKFNRLVVYDREEEIKSSYQNEIRGRVQDKQVKVDLQPQFILTYYEKTEDFDRTAARYDKTISDFNARAVLNMQLKATNNEAALTDLQAAYHFKSIDDYSLVIDRDANDAEAYFARALDFMVLQDLSEAIDDYNRVIALNPDFYLAYFNRAVVRYKLTELESVNDSRAPLTDPVKKRSHSYELIMQDYATVIQHLPDFVYARFNRANLLSLQKNHKAAISDYNEAIKQNPEFAEAYYNRGLTRLSIGDTQKGIADLSRAGELGMVDAYGIIKKMTAD
ncbi:MAG: tetratricopeptide repeat protein [Dysgonamonadaceae bacterium]|jgi:tetratricopeptide (TPR) repeat protein|nr:tetratricopeptide repeat protein [Dysgonamonadaceae bacterium]